MYSIWNPSLPSYTNQLFLSILSYSYLLPKKVSFYTTTSYYCTCTTYYTLYPTFFLHIFFLLLYFYFQLLHYCIFFVFVLHTFCIIFFLCLLWIKEPFSLYYFCFYLIFFFQFDIGNYSYISIFFHFLSRIQKAPSTMTSWQGAKATLL